MGGDTSGCGERQGGSERPRRHPIGWSKNTTILFSKWKRVALSEQPTFSDFSDVSNDFDSEHSNSKKMMRSECIIKSEKSECLRINRAVTCHISYTCYEL